MDGRVQSDFVAATTTEFIQILHCDQVCLLFRIHTRAHRSDVEFCSSGWTCGISYIEFLQWHWTMIVCGAWRTGCWWWWHTSKVRMRIRCEEHQIVMQISNQMNIIHACACTRMEYSLSYPGGVRRCWSKMELLFVLTSKSNVAGFDAALKEARGPNASGADQCCALLSGRPRTSKLQKNRMKTRKYVVYQYYLVWMPDNNNINEYRGTFRSSCSTCILPNSSRYIILA